MRRLVGNPVIQVLPKAKASGAGRYEGMCPAPLIHELLEVGDCSRGLGDAILNVGQRIGNALLGGGVGRVERVVEHVAVPLVTH